MKYFGVLALALAASLAVAMCAVTSVLARPARVSAGDALFARGDFEAAFAAYERSRRPSAGDADARAGAAQIEMYRGRFDAALTDARAALTADHSNDVARRVVTEVMRRHADSATTYEIEPRGVTVDVAFVQTRPLPIVAIAIDGHEARLAVDTGAPGLDLSERFAAAIGVTTHASREAVFAGGKAARVREGGRVRTVAIGGIRVHDVPTGIAPVPGPDVDGVLGTQFLAHFIATIDFARGRLILRPLAESATFEDGARRAGATIVPMYVVPDHFIFAGARIDDGPPALFSIDTGGPGIGVDLSQPAMIAAHIVARPGGDVMFGGGAGAVRAHTFVVRSVSLGGMTVTHVPGINVPERRGKSLFPFTFSGRLSSEFFRGSRLTFDFRAMRLIVSREAIRRSSRES